MDGQLGPVELVERGMRLYEAGDLAGLRRLVHHDAEIQMAYLHGEVARGPQALEEALRAAAHSVHRPRMDGVVAVDELAAILYGRVRYPLDGGGFGDRQAAWLNVIKDGLLWRVRIYQDVEAAQRAYATEFLPELQGSRSRVDRRPVDRAPAPTAEQGAKTIDLDVQRPPSAG